MLRVEELIIGDWVRIIDDDANQSFETRITGVSGLGNIYAPLPEGEHAYPFSVDCIEPIPLTPEILEKNGFVETDAVVVGSRKMIWESEGGRTEITIWMDDTIPMDIRKNIYYEDEVWYTLPFACTVHELQHALRLCGIDKEIEL